MKNENQRRLPEAFPDLYRVKLPYGFECGDGWFDILWQLSEALGSEAVDIPVNSDYYPYATQVKSKCGTLRWRGENLTESMHALIAEARMRAHASCETCGAPGRIRLYRRWYSVCCDEHAPSGSQLVD